MRCGYWPAASAYHAADLPNRNSTLYKALGSMGANCVQFDKINSAPDNYYFSDEVWLLLGA
jgi:hypothetical protein